MELIDYVRIKKGVVVDAMANLKTTSAAFRDLKIQFDCLTDIEEKHEAYFTK